MCVARCLALDGAQIRLNELTYVQPLNVTPLLMSTVHCSPFSTIKTRQFFLFLKVSPVYKESTAKTKQTNKPNAVSVHFRKLA